MYSVSDETRKPIFEGVQGENEAREIQFDVTAWVEELGEGVCTATAKRPTDTTPYPVTVTRSGNVVTWKPNSTDTSIEGIGAFQLAFSINDVVAKTRIWNTKIAPSLVGAGDPPDPYDDWIQDLRDIAAETLTYSQNAEGSAEDAEAWAVGQRGGVDVPSTDPTYENNAKYYAEQSAANQYGAYIVKSASGDIASFNDGADDIPMKSLKVAIVPKQAGSGDPSPTNVRPITGWTDADVHVANKNLFDSVSWAQLGTNRNYYSVASDGRITVTGNDIGSIGTRLFSLKPGAHLKLIINGFGSATIFDSNASGLVYDNFIVPADGKIALKLFASTYPTTGWAMIVPYESTVTEYEPYNGHTTPVPLGQTVYGGEVNPISGELKITHVTSTLDGTELGWQLLYNSQYPLRTYAYNRRLDASAAHSVISSYIPSNVFSGNDENMGIYADSGYLWVRTQAMQSMTTTEEWRAYLQSNPLQICYDIATPTTVQLTPAQVATLLGDNNVWADCGAVEVEYRADPTLAYAELEALILENI